MSAARRLADRRRTSAGPLESWIESRSTLVALALLGIGFVLRLRAASGTFLNPDEALYFFLADRASWAQAYRASLVVPHPPLLTFALYWVRSLGDGELLLRAPSVLAGTAFCWVFYRWLDAVLGRAAALIGLAFTALLWQSVQLSAQARQYELLLLPLISSVYCLERALAEDAAGWMTLSAACLCLGMLAHGASFLFAVSLGAYAALRLLRGRAGANVVGAWVLGQSAALALAVFLYRTHLSKFKGTAIEALAFDAWLRESYFHPGSVHPLVFVAARTFNVFQYALGQPWAGDFACLLFGAGIASLWRGGIRTERSGPSARELAAFLCLPFALNAGAGLLDVYPYGGTRHCVYLAIFALTGVAAAIAALCGGRPARGLTLALPLIALSSAFHSWWPCDIARADQSRAQMDRAVAYVRQQKPDSVPLLVDHESALTFGRSLCPRWRTSYDDSIPGFLVFSCDGGRRMFTPADASWAFDRESFLGAWRALASGGGLRRGQTILVVQAGWDVGLGDDLKNNVAEFHDLLTLPFGNNIKLFKLRVGRRPPRALPAPSARAGGPDDPEFRRLLGILF